MRRVKLHGMNKPTSRGLCYFVFVIKLRKISHFYSHFINIWYMYIEIDQKEIFTFV